MPRPINHSAVVLGVALSAVVVSTRWYRLNISPSLPYGVYALRPVPAQLARGQLVVLPVPVSVQAWWSSWVPLLKPVAAIEGDTVCHLDHKLSVNGADYGLVDADAHGQSLPQIAEGCLVVPAGLVFLASPVVHSLDSRYFGAVPVAALTAQAVPLLTWR
jgi:conjugative transfer signal peptidase TraF